MFKAARYNFVSLVNVTMELSRPIVACIKLRVIATSVKFLRQGGGLLFCCYMYVYKVNETRNF